MARISNVVLVLAVIGMSIIGCKSKQRIIEAPPTVENEPIEIEAKNPSITISEMVDMKNTGDPYTIEHAKILGDTLILQLSYGGGCKEHEFEMLNNNAFREYEDEWANVGYQTHLTLKHNANNDHCRSIVTKEIRFDLISIQQIGASEMNFKLSGWENHLTYTYTMQKH